MEQKSLTEETKAGFVAIVGRPNAGKSTLMNALTSFSLRKAFIPIRMPNDYKAIQACFTTFGPIAPEQVRAVIIRDTLHVTEFIASEALEREIRTIPQARILERVKLRFDGAGVLQTPIVSGVGEKDFRI